MSLFRGEGDASIPRSEVIQIPVNSTLQTTFVVVADRSYVVNAVREIHSVVGGAAATVQVVKVTRDTIAPGAAIDGASVYAVTPVISLTSTINTVQTPAIGGGTNATSLVAKGERIALQLGGTLGTPAGVLQIELQPTSIA